MRKLKFHEQKLLKKADFFDWKNTASLKKASITQKYRLSSRADYGHYEKVVGYITKLVHLVKALPEDDPFRKQVLLQLVDKLYSTGIIPVKSVEAAEKITVSAFLRRRLLIMLKSLKFVETLRESEIYIQHGHVVVGQEVVKDPDFLVTRETEDYITWTQTSKIRQRIDEFKGQKDDYDLLNN